MQVPFLDLKSPHRELMPSLSRAFEQVLDSGWFVTGTELQQFEIEFAAYSGVQYCVGVANGLDAIYLLLLAHGIGPGDEVLVPSNTFIATWLAVSRCGAIPVPVEPSWLTYNLDPDLLEQCVTPNTKAVIPVHLYGQTADMDPIMAFAASRGILVIEDAAQSQGAAYRGKSAGSLGHSAATSFYPGKNLGALGDGGAVLTNSPVIAEKVRELRNYGSCVKYRHDQLGFNSRLDELQAAFLRVKLRSLDAWNERRRQLAAHYTDGLSGLDLVTPHVPVWATPVWHLYVIRTSRRDQLQDFLKANGIGTMVHYPIPPHMQKCYAAYSSHKLPICEALSKDILSLPMYPSLQSDEVQFVIERVRAFFAGQ